MKRILYEVKEGVPPEGWRLFWGRKKLHGRVLGVVTRVTKERGVLIELPDGRLVMGREGKLRTLNRARIKKAIGGDGNGKA